MFELPTIQPRWMWFCVALGAVALLVGCPSFEDGYTGHYQEMEIEEFQDEVVALDLFRFGDEVRAVLRHYDISSSIARQRPFDEDNQVHCRWSRVDRFDEDNDQFSLTMPSTVEWERVELEGSINGDGTIDVELNGEDEEPRELRMEPADRVPSTDCPTIDDFLVRPIFDQEDNGFDPEIYEMQNPVFAILWVGLQRVGQSLVPLNDPSPAIRFSETAGVSLQDNALQGNLSVNVPPPAEQMLIESGDTRYALAHFVVIDDSDDEGGFSWDVAEEPVVATSLEAGMPDDAPEEVEQTESEEMQIDRWGRALLFVEGRLDELDETFRHELLIGKEEAEPDRHFYIVDVFSYYEDQVEFIRLPPRPEANRPAPRRVPVQVTEDHLDANHVPVPRLFPVN